MVFASWQKTKTVGRMLVKMMAFERFLMCNRVETQAGREVVLRVPEA